ncbi:MAG: hypothetical protein H6772_02135 [Pseudomonadales bacterium]|nr:hypothetical protein [Pseudomonadales bacterium]
MPKLVKLRQIRKVEEEKILKEDGKKKTDFKSYKEYRDYIKKRFKEKNIRIDAEEVFTSSEISEFLGVVSSIQNVIKTFQPYFVGLQTSNLIIKHPFASLIEPVEQLQKNLLISKVKITDFMSTIRVAHEAFLDLAARFSEIAESYNRSFQMISDVFTFNANAIKRLFVFMEDQSSKRWSFDFIVPVIRFPLLESKNLGLPSQKTDDQLEEYQQRGIFGFYHQSLHIDKQEDEALVITERNTIDDSHLIEEASHEPDIIDASIIPYADNGPLNTTLSVKSDGENHYIYVSGIGRSKTIEGNPTWLKVLMGYEKNLGIMRKKDIVTIWNQANKNSWKNTPDPKKEDYIPTIHRLVRDNVAKYFGQNYRCINFKRSKSQNFPNSYQMVVQFRKN